MALPRPELGSTCFSANCASSHCVQLLHHRPAVLLMKLAGAPAGDSWRCARLRIIFIYVAQRLQNIAAWFREVRGHFHKLPSSMRQTVGQQDLGAVAQFGRIARQRITHLKGRAEIRCAVLEHIAQIFARVLAAGEVQRDPVALVVWTRCRR